MKIEIEGNESVSVWVRNVGEVIVCQAGVSLRSHRARTVEGPLPYAGFEKIASLFTEPEPATEEKTAEHVE